MKESRLLRLTENVLSLCSEASDAVMNIYESQGLRINEKKDGSPVTLADVRSNKIITKGLSNLEEKFPVLSEENQTNQKIPSDKPFWLVDPLDGTKEFINMNNEFTVNVALILRKKPILGVINIPALKEIFLGIPSYGSFKIKKGEKKRIKTSENITGLCRVLYSKSHISMRDKAFIDILKKNFDEVKGTPAGSSLKLCRIAEGKADIYCRLGPTFQWDIAAGQAIVEGAGGTVRDIYGHQLKYKFDHKRKNKEFYCSGDRSFDWLNLIKNL